MHESPSTHNTARQNLHTGNIGSQHSSVKNNGLSAHIPPRKRIHFRHHRALSVISTLPKFSYRSHQTLEPFVQTSRLQCQTWIPTKVLIDPLLSADDERDAKSEKTGGGRQDDGTCREEGRIRRHQPKRDSRSKRTWRCVTPFHLIYLRSTGSSWTSDSHRIELPMRGRT